MGSSRGKRATAVACLLFLGGLTIAGFWYPIGIEMSKFYAPFVFSFAAAMFGVDAFADARMQQSNNQSSNGGWTELGGQRTGR